MAHKRKIKAIEKKRNAEVKSYPAPKESDMEVKK